jgi:hypothetical protein
MPKKTTKQLEAEVAELRAALEQQTRATAVHQERLAQALPTHRMAGAELMVGIRCIADVGLGLPRNPHIPGDVDVTLDADIPGADPAGTYAIIPYTKWQQIRKSVVMDNALIIRDDSVLGSAYAPAPPDAPEDIAKHWAVNAILDPVAWITERTDDDIRDGIEAMTSPHSLRRLRRVVDFEVRTLQDRHPKPGSVESAVWALRQLPAKYQLVDSLTTLKLEKGDGTEEDVPEETKEILRMGRIR